mmetsp:Transcript_133307/g.231602  ORF Transcript_133307/g.231602 Transcript_133307/m.231602 type:complete len:125 (+) Transcript_133307:68-442(+)
MGKGGKRGGWNSWGSPMSMFMPMFMGKGYGGGKGKGGGKSIISKTKKDKLVWIGGISGLTETDKELNKELKEHLNQAGGCKYVDIGKKGTGGAVFGTAEEATNAIQLLNGSEFKGNTLELDTWS